MEGKPKVFVVGRFPPPVDGQSMATQRLARLLEEPCNVKIVNLSPPDDQVNEMSSLQPDRVVHFLRMRDQAASALALEPNAPVLWTSISPSLLGHARDFLTIRRAFPKPQPVFGVVHRGDFNNLFSRPATKGTGKILFRRLQGLVFLNAMLAAKCAQWVPPHKRHLIPNTIDDEAWCSDEQVEESRLQRKKNENVRLLFLSNMIRSKGYMDVLEAVARLKSQDYHVEIDFIGSWTSDRDREAFEKKVARLGMETTVNHHGPIHDRTRIKNFYLDAHVFLLPTYYPTEAQPLTIIEALNAGTPVITTKQGGIPKMVRENQEAFFVPPRNPAAIADAVQKICAPDRWPAFSTNARKRFEEMFSPETVRAQWLDLLAPYLTS